MTNESNKGYWLRWYVVVLAALVAEVLFFAWLTAWSG
jgi:hypothetical protein